MPALPSNTYRAPYGFQFRIVVPEALRAVIGKREIKKSLGADYRGAVSATRLLAVQVDRQFSAARAQLSQQRQTQDDLEAYLALPARQRLKPITRITPELVAGLHRTYIGSVERGERNISIDNIERIANALQTDIVDLLPNAG